MLFRIGPFKISWDNEENPPQAIRQEPIQEYKKEVLGTFIIKRPDSSNELSIKSLDLIHVECGGGKASLKRDSLDGAFAVKCEKCCFAASRFFKDEEKSSLARILTEDGEAHIGEDWINELIFKWSP